MSALGFGGCVRGGGGRRKGKGREGILGALSQVFYCDTHAEVVGLGYGLCGSSSMVIIGKCNTE